MGDQPDSAAQRREWARIAHDRMHELEVFIAECQAGTRSDFDSITPLYAGVHEALHGAVEDDPPPADTAATDLRPFDRGFSSLAREHGVAAIWVGAHPDGKLRFGGHVQLMESVQQVMTAGMQTMQEQSGRSALIVPNGNGLIVP